MVPLVGRSRSATSDQTFWEEPWPVLPASASAMFQVTPRFRSLCFNHTAIGHIISIDVGVTIRAILQCINVTLSHCIRSQAR